jgi:tetratricopeptide (TPR) repeat protein
MEKINAEKQRLEDSLRKNPEGPEFARLASLYIDIGEYNRALALCNRGIERYPDYATGYLMRALSLKQLKRYAEAADEFRKVLNVVPRCTYPEAALTEVSELAAAAGTKAAEPGATAGTGDSVEELAERLRDYKPRRASSGDIADTKPIADGMPDEDMPIVSETLAMIFFRQQQYDRAIEAFRQLIKRNPEKADIYLTRIKEVEEAKAAAQ